MKLVLTASFKRWPHQNTFCLLLSCFPCSLKTIKPIARLSFKHFLRPSTIPRGFGRGLKPADLCHQPQRTKMTTFNLQIMLVVLLGHLGIHFWPSSNYPPKTLDFTSNHPTEHPNVFRTIVISRGFR